ncbi:ThiF family adenylyltransferase [Leptolyngbya sp. AN03gr2]|uniref:ThiF family adenylyltransferase n=1 Tax=Leptolyngbya sp. AN03gr2 TaxID=3423364 RepID=UPI003D31BDD3
MQNPRQLFPQEHPFLEKRDVIAAIAGKIDLAGKTVELCVGIQASFPRSLPIIYLMPPDAFGMIPHLEEDGYICYIQPEGLLLNAADPVGILVDAVEKAIAVLEAGISGENHLDFMDELPVYWEKIAQQTLPGFLTPNDKPRRVYIYSNKGSDQLIADSIEAVEAFFNRKERALRWMSRRSALYVPLKQGSFMIPPRSKALWQPKDINRFISSNLSQKNRKIFARLRRKSQDFIILGVPRPSGGRTLIGIDFATLQKQSRIQAGVMSLPKPITIERYDSDYLLPRGGGQPDLTAFRVLLIGCGAVGGYVAQNLVQAGIRHLTLLDPEVFSRENIYRHYLGGSALEQPKVTAIKYDLERKIPYLTISAIQSSIEEAIQQNLVDWCNFDLVVVAIGNPTVELYLNQHFHQQKKTLLATFTWLEPYGIGGHALLTQTGQAGCLKCLFNDASDPDYPLHNRSAFAAHGQSFDKDDLGCGRSYMPFSAMDAQTTAATAVRLSISGLLNQEPGNSLSSWKGDSHAFIQAGFKFSPRYQQTTEQLHENRYSYVNDDCPVCRANQAWNPSFSRKPMAAS